MWCDEKLELNQSVMSPWGDGGGALCLSDGRTYDSGTWAEPLTAWSSAFEKATRRQGPLVATEGVDSRNMFSLPSSCRPIDTRVQLHVQSISSHCRWKVEEKSSERFQNVPGSAHLFSWYAFRSSEWDSASADRNKFIEMKPDYDAKMFITFTSLQRASRSQPDRCLTWCHLDWVTHSPNTKIIMFP